MKRLLIAAAALAPVVRPYLAEAGSCHGGSSGGGSSSGSGHSGSGDAYYHPGLYQNARVAPQAPCEDASDVVGYRRCTKFGAWAKNLRIPHIVIEGGAVVRQFGSLLGSQTGSVIHGNESFAYRVLAQPQSRQLDTAVLSTLRAGIGLPHGFYTAVEVDLGALAQPGRASTEMMTSGSFGSPELQQQRGFVVDSVGTIGVHGATHAGGLGVELAGGLRAVSYSFHSSYHDCEGTTRIRAFAPIAEARVRGELWLSPWLTAGVIAGTSVIEQHSWMGGVYLGVHTRSFGGDR
jgi:hypothetical protein